MIPTQPPVIDESILDEAEAAISHAIQTRDASSLRVLGFGETSVAVGWPTNDPTMVLKRMAVYADRDACDKAASWVAAYVERLEAAGAQVLPTSTHVVTRADGRYVGYAVQPLVPKEMLAETTIANDEPRADHPLVLALRDFAVQHVTPELSADLQFTNFAWDGERLVLIDITSPIMFDAGGEYLFEITPELLAPVPLFMRKPVLKEAMEVLGKYRSLPRAFTLVLVLLHRIRQQRWVPAAAEAFNQVLDAPLDLQEVQDDYDRYRRVVPLMNRSSMLQRWWVTKVRRGSYDFFITDSFTGDVL